MTSLPQLPSELLSIALDDIEKSVAQGHKINMLVFCDIRDEEDNTCEVCLAGSVMLQRLDVVSHMKKHGWKSCPVGILGLPRATEDRLYALDAMRAGDWRHGFFRMGIAAPEDLMCELCARPCWEFAAPLKYNIENFRDCVRLLKEYKL